VLADDNDIFVLLVYFLWKWKTDDAKITMKKSDGEVVDINKSVATLGQNAQHLLALHALTGCDSVSYTRMGSVRQWLLGGA
jgi:hypothetical protein